MKFSAYHRPPNRFVLAGALAMLLAVCLDAAVPVPPNRFGAGAWDASNYLLVWADNSDNETGFEIQASNGNGWVSLGTTAPNQESAILSLGVPAAQLRVQAVNGPEESGFAPQLTVSLDSFTQPSELRSDIVNDGIHITWADNSYTETAVEIESRELPGGSFAVLGSIGLFGGNASVIPSIDLSGATALTPGASHVIRIRSRKGSTGSFQYTAYSNEHTVAAPPLSPPTGLTASATGERTVVLNWTDNGFSEHGFAIEARQTGTTTWNRLTYANPNAVTFTLTGTAFPAFILPGLSYEFRVLAVFQKLDSSIVDSAPSNTAAATTPFNAPTGLNAVLQGENTVNLTWTDTSGSETGYYVLARLAGAAQFTILNVLPLAASTQSYAATGLLPKTNFEFAVIAAYDISGSTVSESAPSNIVPVSTLFFAPSNLTASSINETSLALSWTQTSAIEHGYEVLVRLQGETNWNRLSLLGANSTTANVSGLSRGTGYDFSVRGYFNVSQTETILSDQSPAASPFTKDGFTSDPHKPITLGTAFSHQVQTSTHSARTSLSATGLPGGLSLDSLTGIISGTPTVDGLFNVALSAAFADGWNSAQTLALRITRSPAAPQTAANFANLLLSSGGSSTASVTGKFTDPDTQSVVRLDTTKGNVDIILYNSQTPGTVANFTGYVGRGDYNNSAFHRISTVADSGVVVLQGGQYKRGTVPSNAFTEIPLQAAIQNEAGISNLPYTIAMAKAGGNPNSATSQFYFNLDNVNTTLDPASQNGGFTVFGRVSNATKANLDLLKNGPPGGPYTISVNSQNVNSPFKWPMNVPTVGDVPASMDNSKVMVINSASQLPAASLISHSVSSSHPAIATAVLAGADVNLNALSAGVATITVTATDIDGQSGSQNFTVTVDPTYSQWAAAQGLPPGETDAEDDPDNDELTNLEEFAFMGNPSVPGDPSARPAAIIQDDAGVKKAAITFKIRKGVSGLSYAVQKSINLGSASWTVTLWQTTDGLAAPNITVIDNGDHYVATVRDSTGLAGGSECFLRVQVTAAP